MPKRSFDDLEELRVFNRGDKNPGGYPMAIVEMKYKDGKAVTFSVDLPNLDYVFEAIKQQWAADVPVNHSH